MEKQIVSYMRLVNATEALPVKVKEIAEHLEINESDSSCPTTRKLIRKAIEEDGVAIGSNHRGYFLINTEREMQVYMNRLMSRMVSLSKRIGAVNDAFYGKK